MIFSNICRYLDENIDDFENEIDNHIIMGAVGGSYSLGLNNASSDIDFYLVCKDKLNDNILCIRKNVGRGLKVDFICISIQDAYTKMNRESERYPTCIFRTKEYEKNVKDSQRPEFAKDVVYRCIMADKRWTRKQVFFDVKSLNKYVSLIDVLDYNFTRIYGNYMKFILDKERVLVRKYLYVLQEVYTCFFVLDYKSKPPMRFDELFSIYKNKMIHKNIGIINDMYKCNFEASKDKNSFYVESSFEINEYIRKALEEIKKELEINKKKYIDNYIELC